MAVVGDIYTMIQIIQQLYDGAALLFENWHNCKRLADRTQIFLEVLEKYKNNPSLITPMVEVQILGFKQVVVDIETFIRKYRKQTVSKAMTKVLFRNTLAREISNLNNRLNDYALNLGVIQNLDYEQRRAEDVEDTKRTFERSVSSVIDQISLQRETSEDAMDELRSDIAQNTEAMREILSIISTLPVTEEEMKIIRQETEALQDYATQRHIEVVRKLDTVERKVDDLHSLLASKDVESAITLERQKREAELLCCTIPFGDLSVENDAEIKQTESEFALRKGKFGHSTVVAIKSPARVDEQLSNTKLKYEVLLLRSLSLSPHIVRCFGISYGSAGGSTPTPRIVYEFAGGASLADVYRATFGGGNRVTKASGDASSAGLRDSLSWMCQIAEAVDFLTQRHIVHTSIQPSHILLFPTSNPSPGVPYSAPMQAKLTGLGHAVRVDPLTMVVHPAVPHSPLCVRDLWPSSKTAGGDSAKDSSSWTSTSLVNIYFQAPELMDSEANGGLAITPAADVYSLSRVTGRLLGGRQNLTSHNKGNRGSIDEDMERLQQQARQEVWKMLDECMVTSYKLRPKISEVLRTFQRIVHTLPTPPVAAVAQSKEDALIETVNERGNHKGKEIEVPTVSKVTKVETTDSSVNNLVSAVGPMKIAPPISPAAVQAGPLSGLRARLTQRAQTSLRYSMLNVGQDIAMNAHRETIKALHLLRDGRVVSGSYDDSIRVWLPPTPAAGIPDVSTTASSIASTATTSDGSSEDSSQINDNGEGDKQYGGWKCLATLVGHSEDVTCLSSIFLPGADEDKYGMQTNSDDGLVEYILSGSEDKTMVLWDSRTGTSLRTFRGHTHAIYTVLGLSEAQLCISGSWDRSIKLWDALSGECLITLLGHTKSLSALAWIPSRQWLASTGVDATIRLWNLESQECVRTLSGHTDAVSCLILVEDPRGIRAPQLLSGGGDKTLRLWDVDSGNCLRIFQGHRQWVLCAQLINFRHPSSSDEQQRSSETYIIAGDLAYTLRLWNLSSGQCEQVFGDEEQDETRRKQVAHSGCVFGVVVLDDGRVVSCSGDNSLRLWHHKCGNNGDSVMNASRGMVAGV